MSSPADAPPDMAGVLRQVLRDHGPGILGDRGRLHALLRETAGDSPRRIHLLMNAFDAGVPARLQATAEDAALFDLDHETARVVDAFGSSPEFAREAVETWRQAMREAPPRPPAPAPASAPPGPEASGSDGPGSVPPPLGDISPAGPTGSSVPGPGTAPGPQAGPAEPAPSPIASPRPLPLPIQPAAPPQVQPLPLPQVARPAGPPPLPAPSPAETAGPAPLAEPPPNPPLPPVRPLPLPGAAPGLVPPVRPLPTPSGPAPIRRLPGATGGMQATPPAAGATGPAHRTSGTPVVRVVAVLFGLGLLAMIGYGLYTVYGPKAGIRVATGKPSGPQPEHGPEPGPGPSPEPRQEPRRAPVQTPAPGGAPRAGDAPRKSEEGYPVATTQEPGIKVPAQRIDGSENTLLFTFGLEVAQRIFTYQAAFGFEGSNRAGRGLIKAFKGGREATTGEQDVNRIVREDGTTGFTLSSRLSPNPIGAPAICVSVLAGKAQDRLDIANGAGYFCAFGTDQNGYCDGSVRLGCGDLE